MVNSKTYRGSYEKEKGTDESGCELADRFDTGRKKEAVPAKHTGAGKKLYGIRGRAGKPKNVERVSEDTEEYTSTTRFLESSLGIKSHAELAPHLAKGVERVMAALIQLSPEDLIVTPELICKLHKDAFGELFPLWAGRYRDRDVIVGGHTAPPYYEVPGLIMQYCHDLEARLNHLPSMPSVSNVLIETLAFAEGRFLSIHPFLDFNGRVARMFLFALLLRLDLPPVELVPAEDNKKGRAEYLTALSRADKMDWQPLKEIWKKRLGVAG